MGGGRLRGKMLRVFNIQLKLSRFSVVGEKISCLEQVSVTVSVRRKRHSREKRGHIQSLSHIVLSSEWCDIESCMEVNYQSKNVVVWCLVTIDLG